MATVDQNTMEAEVGSQEPGGCSPQVVLHLPALFFFFSRDKFRKNKWTEEKTHNIFKAN